MGMHSMGWQRPNGLAQKGVAEAKWACTEGSGRGQMGLHRMGWQRPNGHAQHGVQRPNGLAQKGVAEAKWACTGWGGRGQMGLHRMERQRPNGLAQNGTEITARDTELSPKPSLYIHFRMVIFRPRCRFRTYWSRCLEGINILGLGNTQCFKEIHSEKKWPFQVKGCTNGSPMQAQRWRISSERSDGPKWESILQNPVLKTNTLSQVPDVQLAAPNGGIFCSAFK
ncbi:hypothetical protein B0H13DRAFT_2485001 [Mycena leptocephala]|nr:hypothetical protein B0H13DRAFT_2485001 [Mycena leptocephala]